MEKIYVLNTNDKGYEEIDMQMIKRLAGIAMSLESKNTISEAEGHCNALYDYIEESADNELKSEFKRINSIMFAHKLLIDTIELMTLEEDMRENGINPKNLEYYQLLCNEYRKYFSISNDIRTNMSVKK